MGLSAYKSVEPECHVVLSFNQGPVNKITVLLFGPITLADYITHCRGTSDCATLQWAIGPPQSEIPHFPPGVFIGIQFHTMF